MILSAIFRKVSLERLSSPEQLDQMVQVTDPKGWIALAGLGALLLAAIAWGIWGSIPPRPRGTASCCGRGGSPTWSPTPPARSRRCWSASAT